MTSVRIVLGTGAWRAWLAPFLDDPRFDIEFAEPSVAPARAVVFLSRHATLRRDLTFAGPLEELGVPVVVCQPAAVAELALDKRRMAARAAVVDGLRPIPELSPAEAQRALAEGRARMVVAKPVDGTEGQDMFFFRRAEDLTTTGVRLFEGGYVLQPFIDGEEYSVNMMWNGGRCSVYPPVAKGRAGEAHPIFRTRRCPAPLADTLLNRCVEYMRPFAPSGPVEVELICAGDEAFLLDVNPRLSATLRLSAVAAESNPFTDLIADALGLAPLGRVVASRRPALEWPLPRDLDDDERAALAGRKDVWISTRVTLAAPDLQALEDRADELRWLLDR